MVSSRQRGKKQPARAAAITSYYDIYDKHIRTRYVGGLPPL
jgi:hypothetical protein